MHTLERRRLPISTRHAFALAFDLAVRRDPLHSLAVPLLLRAPWSLALVLLPPPDSGAVSAKVLGLTSLALIGDFITLLVVGAMLRLRARSVFNTPQGVRPAAAADCYARGMRRIPWLLVTEVVRNLVLAIAASLIVLPTAFVRFHPETALGDLGRNLVLLGIAFLFALPSLSVVYRLGVATEAVVLDEHDLAGAFQSSFRMMRGHLERWFELILASGVMVLAPALVLAALSLAIPALAGPPGVMIFWLVVVGVGPVIQYAWTFFYLRLVEIEFPLQESAPAYAAGVPLEEAVPLEAAVTGVAGLGLVPSSTPGVSGTDAPGA
ncbi:MAG: hypothetical protein AAB290_03360 [Candidatus Eisenbacteria bacterium]